MTHTSLSTFSRLQRRDIPLSRKIGQSFCECSKPFGLRLLSWTKRRGGFWSKSLRLHRGSAAAASRHMPGRSRRPSERNRDQHLPPSWMGGTVPRVIVRRCASLRSFRDRSLKQSTRYRTVCSYRQARLHSATPALLLQLGPRQWRTAAASDCTKRMLHFLILAPPDGHSIKAECRVPVSWSPFPCCSHSPESRV